MATLVDFIGTDAGTGPVEAQELMTRTVRDSASILVFKAHLFGKNTPPEHQSQPAPDVAATEYPYYGTNPVSTRLGRSQPTQLRSTPWMSIT
jgi:hypothetical protein